MSPGRSPGLPKLARRSGSSVILLILASILTIYPMLPPGIPSTADGPLHLIRSVEFDAVLRSGVLYPRWAPDLAYGYGYPLFNYYAPLLYYATEIPHLLGASFELAFKLTIFATFLLYPLAMYWWVRPLLGDTAAMVAGIAYLFVPFRFHEAYMQGDYAQFLAMALAPLAFGALHRLLLADRITFRHVVVLTLSLCALVLVHNISTLWLAPTLAGYALALGIGCWIAGAMASPRGHDAFRASAAMGPGDAHHRDTENTERNLEFSASDQPSRAFQTLRHLRALCASVVNVSQRPNPSGGMLDREKEADASSPSPSPMVRGKAGEAPVPLLPSPLVRLTVAAGLAMLALGLTAFFWLPALAEQNLVQLYRLRTDDYDVRHSFITLATLLAPPTVVDQTAANPPPFLHLGWGQIALALATLPLLALALRARAAKGAIALPRSLVAHLIFGWLLLLSSAAMTLPFSLPVWRRIPLIAYTQFPWRVLELSGLATALLAGIAVYLALVLPGKKAKLRTPESVRDQGNDWRISRERAAAPASFPRLLPGIPKSASPRPSVPTAPRHERWGTTVAGVALLVLIVPSLVYLYPREPFLVYGHLTAADVTAYERNGGAVGTTSTGEYYPLDVTDRPKAPLPSDLSAIGRLDRSALPVGSQVTFLGSSGYTERYTLTLPRPATLRFDLIRFAGWQVTIDGRPAQTRSSPGQGLLEVDAPAGSHRLVLSFVDTPIRRLGWTLALVSLALLAATAVLTTALAGRSAKQPGRSAEFLGATATTVADEPPHPNPLPEGEGMTGERGRNARVPSSPSFRSTPLQLRWRREGSPWRRGSEGRPGGEAKSSVAVLGAILLVLIALRVTSPAPYAQVFARRSPLDHVVGVQHPAQVRLENTVEFLGYDLSSATVQPGGKITVTLYWRALRPLHTDYRSLAMIARVGDRGLLTQDDRVNPGSIPTHTWPTDRYFLDQHTITIPANAPPMVYQLQVALYNPRTLAHLQQEGVSGYAGQQIVLQQLHVTRVSPVNPNTYRAIGNPVFGGDITLVGYQVNSTHLHPGDSLELTLIWRANRPLAKNYTVFTHLVDSKQQQVAGNDSMPIDGQYPTSTWLAGEEVVDAHRIALPANLPPGQYHLAFGLYDAKTLQRLDATEKGWNGPRSQIDLDDLPIHVEPRG